MICDFCKSNEASIHLIKVTNNNVEKINLCMDCIKNYSFFSTEDFFTDLTKILSKFFEIDIKISAKEENDKLFENVSVNDNKKCSFCNIDLNTIKSIGRVGCANCYNEFRDVLNPIVKTIHGSLEHKGKVPVKSSNDIKIEKEIRDLKYQLKEEVTVENFEVAAKLRDTIKKLQKKLYIGKNVN
ncbi:MAG: UvrB/UvrC motif-containing protein [Actinobacteria bacterium]|nr:UvrB/UvrC motif-containing protein [Actinomycetota bacterium]